MTDSMNPSRHEHAAGLPQLLTVREVAAELRVSTSLVYELIESKKLACHRIGKGRGAIRVGRVDLDRFVEECRVESQPPRVRTPRPQLKHLHVK
jgi:excisionase family DNA binding protein